MKMSEQVITKGEYQYPQLNEFVLLKHYIILKRGDKKFILFRFSNKADFVINGIKFEILQFDANGHKIGKNTVDIQTLSENPGAVFTLRDGFAIDSKCMDFKISIIDVYSKDYVYSGNNEESSVTYAPDRYGDDLTEELNDKQKDKFFVTSKRRTSYTFAFTMAIFVALAVCAISSFAYYSPYIPWWG